jgi:hypothetical protein
MDRSGGNPSDNVNNGASLLTTVTATTSSSAATIRLEMLCFVQNKCNIMPFDHVVEICCDFYSPEEIEKTRADLSQYVGQRFPKRQGNDAKKKKVADIVKTCLDTAHKLPAFYAVDLARLPPVGVEHIDISALLLEVASLRAEVRALASIREDVMNMRWAISGLSADTVDGMKSTLPMPAKLSANVAPELDVAVDPVPIQHTDVPVGAVPLMNNIAADLTLPIMSPGYSAKSRSAAEIVADAVKSGSLASSRRPQVKPVVGRAACGKLRAITAKRPVHVFVTRLNPDTADSDVSEYIVQSVKSIAGVNVPYTDIVCEKLNTKFASYVSFHVSIIVTSDVFSNVLNSVLCADAWPEGVLVRKFFTNKKL